MISGTFKQLLTNLRALIDTVDSIQEKHIAPTFEFNGYPAVFIAPSGNDSDYLTSNDNQRIYAFQIWAFVEYDETSGDAAYTTLIDVIDDLLNVIDKQESPDAQSRIMDTNLGDGVTLLAVVATPSQFLLDTEEKLLAAQVTVKLKTTIDLTLLT